MERQLADRKDPVTWSAAERINVRAYLERIDATDAAFNNYQRVLRANKKTLQGDKSTEAWSNAAKAVNIAETAWKQAKDTTAATRKGLGALAETMVDLGAGKKASREVLREKLERLTPQQENPESTVDVEEVVEVVPEESPLESATDLENRLIAGGLAAPMPGEALAAPETPRPSVTHKAPAPRTKEPPAGGIMRRIAKSRIAKAAYAVAAVLGLGGKAVGAVEDFRDTSEKRAQAHETVRHIAMESSFGMAERYGVVSLDLPHAEDVIHFPDGETKTRGELIGMVDTWYTTLIKDGHGPMGIMTEQCSATLPDGSSGLDALKCNDLYGDQVRLDSKALSLLAEVHGYRKDEIITHGKIIRDSVMQLPSGVAFGNGTLTMTYFDVQNLSDTFDGQRAEIYDGYYNDASKMAFTAIRALDIGSADKEKIAAIQSTIKAEILLSNATMLAAADTMYIKNTYAAEALMHGLDDKLTGQHFASHMEKLTAAHEDADLAWKKLAAHEQNTNGPLHTMERGLAEVHVAKLDTLLRAGRDAGDHVDFFLDQLEKISDERPQ